MTIVVVRRQKRITMEGSASSINSRATAIKTILLAAWRVKASNEDWEARIRKVLPRGVNGDVYDLADCLLKQALVGPVPNQLFISYLKHAVKCELISHGAVLTSIAQQSIYVKQNNTTLNRTSSVICLLEFLKTFRSKISCKGTEIECLNLCHSLSQLIHWLLRCVQSCLESLNGVSNAQNTAANPLNINLTTTGNLGHNNIAQYESTLGIIDLCTEAIHYFTNRPFTKSLLFVSKIEYAKEFDEINKTVQVIQQKFSSCLNLQLILERVEHHKILQQLDVTFNSRDMHPSVVAAQQLKCLQVHRIRSTHVISGCKLEKKVQQSLLIHDSTTNYALFNSLYSSIAFDVVLRAARPIKLLAKQISTITNFNSAPISMTYCELIRICMIGLIDASGTSVKVKWSFFTFIKLPKLLIELTKVHNCQTNQESPNNYITNFINDLRLAFGRLCEYSPLLDEVEYETRCNCDILGCLVKELIKNDPNLIQLESIDFKKFPSKRVSTSNNDRAGGHLILKSEPVVTSILKTFDTVTNPVDLYSIICQWVEGSSFELSLNAAASSGKLELLVKKLVEHNELNRIPRNDSPKSPQIQALIFDITFLMLTYIAQQYGSDVIGSDQQTTFNKWFYDSYNSTTRINCPKEMLKDCNGEVVSSLIKQMVNPDLGIQMKSVNWREVCINLPKAIHEILVAWTQGHLSDIHMIGIIERIKSRVCFVAVVAAAWLQCHIRTLNDTDKIKPLSLLENLTKASQEVRQQEKEPDMKSRSEHYTVRSSIMCSIIRKIYFELVPKISHPNPVSNSGEESPDESSYHSTNDKFVSIITTQEIFLANVKQCLNRGWIDHKSLNSLSSLFKMIGSDCFTNFMVEQILTSHESPSDLSRAVNITYGLFHLDIEACAFSLLKTTIPSWLMGEKKQVLLNQPRAFALAHLTVMTIIEVFNNLETSQVNNSCSEDRRMLANGIKREPGEHQNQLSTESHDAVAGPNGPRDVKRIKLMANDSHEKDHSQDVLQRLEKLNSCIADLMRLFTEIMSDSVMCQRTLFPVLFLQQTVVCAREGSSIITVHLQPEILLDIINLFSSELTFELVLAISNLSTTKSRSFAAKAVCQLAQVKESKQNKSVQLSQPSTSKLSSYNQPSSNSSTGAGGANSSRPVGPTPMILG